MSAAHRLVLNSGLLLLRAVFTLLLGLFSTRYILDALGALDFGVYSLVGSVVAFLAFLNNSMARATTRFLSFHQREEDKVILSKVFNSSLLLHLLIAVVVVILLELSAGYLFGGVLNIDRSHLPEAKYIFQCMAVSFFCSILGAPYDGCIIAHEKFIVFTGIGLFEAVAKFGISFLLYVTPFGRLETYGTLIMSVSIVGVIIRWVYCQIRFSESKIIAENVDGSILRNIASFSVWSLFDLLSSVFKYSAMDVLINMFHGTLANAAYAVSKQVSGALLSFSSSIYSASRPQIVQSVGRNDTIGAVQKTIIISRWGFALMSFASVPLLVEMPSVLGLWLKKVPDHTVVFCQLSLLSNLVGLMTIRGFSVLLDGIGRIKAYWITMSVCNMLAFPAAYLLMRQGFPPYAIFLGVLLSDVFQTIATVHYTVRYTDLTWVRYLREVPLYLVPIVVGVTGFLSLIPWSTTVSPLTRLIGAACSSSLLLTILFGLAMNKGERIFARGMWTKFRAMIQVRAK
jgi:Na+-driven multidrug efflux pump